MNEFARAARLAVFAGFDGVQVHSDSGYLLHQFLSTNVNLRQDRYGGSPQNRARLSLEVLDAVIAVNGASYVSIKLTPGLDVHDIEEDDIPEKYAHIVDELNQRQGLSFLHLYFHDLAVSRQFKSMRDRFKGLVLAEGSLKPEQYARMLVDGELDFTGVGRPFIANPDYIARLQNGWTLSRSDPETIYSPGAEGYVDYPAWDTENPAASVVGLNFETNTNALLKVEAQV